MRQEHFTEFQFNLSGERQKMEEVGYIRPCVFLGLQYRLEIAHLVYRNCLNNCDDSQSLNTCYLSNDDLFV